MKIKIRDNLVEIEKNDLKKKVEIISNNLIRIYIEKTNSSFCPLNLEKEAIEIKNSDNTIVWKEYVITFDDRLNISLYKNKTLLVQETSIENKYSSQINLKLDKKHYIYGLGDKAAFINRNGYEYVSWNTDDPSAHNELYKSLYKSINYLLINNDTNYIGLYYPSTFKTTFNLCKDKEDILYIGSEKGKYDYFLILGNSPKEITSAYSTLVGKPFLPQIKMLGYQQSRWSYSNEKEVMEIANNFKKYNLPLDYIHLDIDYMDGYRDFTIDSNRFPNMKELSKKLKSDGIGLVAIFDAGVKLDKEYDFCKELLDMKGVLTLDEKEYVNTVWPGESIFPNYFDEKVNKYITYKAEEFIENNNFMGIWCDMNEPASFNGPLPENVEAKVNNKIIYHEEFHNIYGEYMVRSISQAFINKKIRPYVISRAVFATSSPFTCVWNGDNQSLWEHLEVSLPQIATMNICNFPFDGVDIGGFSCDTNRELLIRWIEANIFSLFLRNHSAINTTSQEPWSFDDELINIYRKMLKLRYKFIPYLYDASFRAAMYGEPVIKPLFFDYPLDDRTKEINDEILIGNNLLYAPILKQGAKSRVIYLPEGTWYNYFTHEKYIGGKEYLLSLDIDEVGLFVKEGSILPYYLDLNSINKDLIDTLYFDCSFGDGRYINYDDDGYSLDYKDNKYNIYEVIKENGNLTLNIIKKDYNSKYKKIVIDDGVNSKSIDLD